MTWHAFVISCEFMPWVFLYSFLQRRAGVVLGACMMVNKKRKGLLRDSVDEFSHKVVIQMVHNMLLLISLCLSLKLHVTIKIPLGENNVCGPLGIVDSSFSTVF